MAIQIGLGFSMTALGNDYGALSESGVSDDLVFEERNGFLAVEAEHFVAQSVKGKRAWYRHSAGVEPMFDYDADRQSRHGQIASGNRVSPGALLRAGFIATLLQLCMTWKNWGS